VGASACVATVARLPWQLNSVVAPTFLGFVLINGLTFGVDLLLLSGARGPAHADTVRGHPGLRCAFTLSYFLNRTMNFASHAPVGPQFAVYLAAVLANYLAFILGLSSAVTLAVFRR
jgi:hypothetical protein